MENSKHHLIVSMCLTALLLSGCVSDRTELSFAQGKYHNYRDLLVSTAAFTKFPKGTPSSVKDRYAQCSADFVLTAVSPVDLPSLDAYAQGVQSMPVGELNRINSQIEAKLGRPLTHGGLERLAGICPNDVADFQKFPPHD